ncbi:YdcH family protein [Rhodoblastus sp.]|uniref:YdcH family protein n=1 Tax=Rhodoblastus sp. TaxID=1962975 RepID=UPI003F956C7B
MSRELSEEERAEFANEIERLRQEHRDLDAAIDALMAVGANDALQLQRLKKRKLALRDRISFLEDTLTPDIIA